MRSVRWWWLVLAACLQAGDWEWTLNSDSFASWERQALPMQDDILLSQRLRFNGLFQMNDRWHWDLAYEVNGFKRKNLLLPILPTYLRADDLNTYLEQSNDGALLQNLDRLKLSWERDDWQFSLGRQAVGHGNGRFFNPSDLFAPLTPFSLNSQYKTGIDGLTLNRAVGEDTQWGMMAFFPEEGQGLILGKYATRLKNWDVSALFGKTYEEWTLAWDVATTVAGAAVYGEGLARKGQNRDDVMRLSLGVSRRFGTKWDVTLEAQHHNLGTDHLLAFFFLPEVQHGELFQINENQLALLVSYQIHPLVRLDSFILTESHEHSAWWQNGATWDVSQRGVLRAGLLLTKGQAHTEYGIYSESLFLEYRLTLP